MASIFRKEGTQFLWGKWSDGHGGVHRGSMETTDEVLAQQRADELERLARAAYVPPPPPPAEDTMRAFVGTEKEPGEWLKTRQISAPLAWPDDLSRLEYHFLDAFGGKALRWLESDDGKRALFQWGISLPTHKVKRDNLPLAPRSVWNVFSSVKVMLDDAVELQRLKVNPLATFRTDKYLPEKQDKRQDGWRENSGFTLEQVVELCSSDKLRPHRRVWHAISFLVGGPRPGEAANLRFRDWQPSYKGGLGRMTIGSAWNSRAKIEKRTKTGARKHIPVHPWAGGILKDWLDRGWEEWTGRKPTPDDLICPRSDFRQFGNSALLDYFHADLKALGMPLQRAYESRSTFRNLLLQAGANEFHVNLLTHAPVKQASDYYTRLEMQWPAMCEAILKLRVSAGTGVPERAQAAISRGNWRGVRDSNPWPPA